MRRTVSISVALLLTGQALATEGYFTHAWGTKSKGMAGADLAYPQNPLSAAENPANLAFVGRKLEVSLGLFQPHRDYSATTPTGGTFPLTPGTFDSGHTLFAVPSLAANWPQKGERSSLGVLIYGNGGMNTEYANQVFYAGAAGVNLEQLFIAPTYAYKFDEATSVGVSLIAAYQKFSATGLGSFASFSQDPSNLTDKGDDTSTGIGARVGVTHKESNGVSFAASYQPKISMERFKDYAGLFAEQGKFDIPENYSVGVAYERAPGDVWAFSVRHIKYSGVPAVSNPFATGGALGSDNGPGFGWQDMTVFKLGTQWTSGSWAFRAGASYTHQPVPKSETLFNILAPGVETWQLTAGLSKEIGNHELNFALLYAPTYKVSGPNPMAPSQNITLSMYEVEAEIGYTLKF